MKRFDPLWRIVVALLLLFALAPVIALSVPAMAGAPDPDTFINDIPDDVADLDSITGYADDDAPDYIAEVKIKIERTTDNKWWSGSAWQDLEGWLDTTPTDGSFNSERERWQYTSVPSWESGKDYEITAKAYDNQDRSDASPPTDDFTYDPLAPDTDISAISANVTALT